MPVQKEAKCYKCGKVGHFQKVCRQGTQQARQPLSRAVSGQGEKKAMNVVKEVIPEVESVTSMDSTGIEYGMFPVSSTTQDSCKPFEVEMLLDGQAHKMEVDTGAAVSVVSKETYQ